MNNNVLFVAVALRGGGAERVMVSLANQMKRNGYQVAFLLVVSNEVVYSLDPGITIIKLNKGRHNPLSKLLKIRKEFKKLNSGTIISFFTNQNLLTILANTGLKNKVIVSERCDPHKSAINSYIRFFRKYLYAYADRVVFQTREALEYYPKAVQRKGIIIPNPIKENLPNIYKGIRNKQIVTFSRLSEQKNIPMLLDACKIIFNKYNGYILDIYGTGELEEELITYTEKIGIDDKVYFNGFCTDVHERILKAAMYISTSDYEGLSNSMLEAMAMGIPCICTDCPAGGAKMFIHTYENGILIPVGDVNALVTAMESIIEDRKLSQRLSENSSQIYNLLSINNIFEKWKEII